MGRCQASDPETGQRCMRTDNLEVSHRDGFHQALAPGQPGLQADHTTGCLIEGLDREYIRWPMRHSASSDGES